MRTCTSPLRRFDQSRPCSIRHLVLAVLVLTLAACNDTRSPTEPATPPALIAANALGSPTDITILEKLTYPGAFGGRATGINARRQVAGHFHFFGGSIRAFRWAAGTGVELLPASYGQSWSFDLDDAGTMVGRVEAERTDRRSFLWDGNGAFQDLGPTSVGAINNNGVVVGTGSQGSTGIPARLPSGGSWTYPLNPFHTHSIGSDVNDHEWIVGYYGNSGPTGGAYFPWVSFAPLSGGWFHLPQNGLGATVAGVSNTGWATGVGKVPDGSGGRSVGLLWNLDPALSVQPDPTVIDIAYGAWTTDVNDGGVVVGGYKNSGWIPFRWESNSHKDLPRLNGYGGWPLAVSVQDHAAGFLEEPTQDQPVIWWRYRDTDIEDCDCPPPSIQAAYLIVTLMSSKRAMAEDIAMNTVTVGPVENVDPQVRIATRDEALLVEYADVNRDGLEDALLFFDYRELKAHGLDRKLDAGALLLTGASMDRSYALAHVLAPPKKGK